MYHLLLTSSPFIFLQIAMSPVCYAFWQPFESKGFEWEQDRSICPNFINLSTLLHHIVEKPLPGSEKTTFLAWALAVTNQLRRKQQCGFWKAPSFLLWSRANTKTSLVSSVIILSESCFPLTCTSWNSLPASPWVHPHLLQSIPYQAAVRMYLQRGIKACHSPLILPRLTSLSLLWLAPCLSTTRLVFCHFLSQVFSFFLASSFLLIFA